MYNSKVSIIVPVYNSHLYLNRCIDSLIIQSYKNIEILLIDDGSTDESSKICEKYSKIDDRVKYIYKKNGGSSTARNFGIMKSSGDYIMFVDSDDSIEINMVKSLLDLIESSNTDFAISGMRVICENGEIKEYRNKYKIIKNISKNPNELIDLFVLERINGPVAKLFKTSIIKENNILMPEGIHLNEDLNFNVDYLKKINSIAIDSNCYYNYYHNGSESVTTRYYENRYDMLNSVNNNIINYFNELYNNQNSKNSKSMGNIYFLYVKMVYSSFINLFHKDCKKNKNEKKKIILDIIKSKNFEIKINKAKRDGLKYKLLLIILKTRNCFIIYNFCKLLNFLRNKGIAKY